MSSEANFPVGFKWNNICIRYILIPNITYILRNNIFEERNPKCVFS